MKKKDYKQSSKQGITNHNYKYWYFLLFILAIIVAVAITLLVSKGNVAGEAVKADSSYWNCKSFQASPYSFNDLSITGSSVCRKNKWGICHAVITTDTISYSYDKSNIFLTSASISQFVDCDADLKSYETSWNEIIEPWNPFGKKLYQIERQKLVGGSVLCCK